MKKLTLLLLFLLLIVSLIFYKLFNPPPYNKGPYTSQINNGLHLYTPSRIKDLRFDEYWLLYEIDQVTGNVRQDYLISLKKKYKDNPYNILIDKNDYMTNIQFKRNMDKVGTNKFYTIPNAPSSIVDWDPILLKALHCDKTGYDDKDFKTISALKNKGKYYDTHYLLGLVFLRENNCYKKDVIEKEIKTTASIIIKEANTDREFSDLHAERITMLYWAGYGKSLKKESIDMIANSFSSEYGWNDKGKKDFSGHATGLSLLSLIYYTEGKNKQPLYK